MRVLFLVGAYPPERCGIADYTKQLALKLQSHNEAEIFVLSGRRSDLVLQAEQEPETVSFRTRVGVLSVWWACRLLKPSVVHLQYPSIRHISRLVPFFVKHVLRIPVVQTWHEHYLGCGELGRWNFWGLDRLIYVRPDFLDRLPLQVRKKVDRISAFVPNASAIGVMPDDDSGNAAALRSSISKKLVVFFGFIVPQKGVERLFELVDPATSQLVLIGHFDDADPYHLSIKELASRPSWKGSVTLTGFAEPALVARYLAIADAAVFPFLDGVGSWNTSVQAAADSGTPVFATSNDPDLAFCKFAQGICLVPVEKWRALKEMIQVHAGRRRHSRIDDPWKRIADSHVNIYTTLLKELG